MNSSIKNVIVISLLTAVGNTSAVIGLGAIDLSRLGLTDSKEIEEYKKGLIKR